MNVDTIGLAAACVLPIGFAFLSPGTQEIVDQQAAAPAVGMTSVAVVAPTAPPTAVAQVAPTAPVAQVAPTAPTTPVAPVAATSPLAPAPPTAPVHAAAFAVASSPTSASAPSPLAAPTATTGLSTWVVEDGDVDDELDALRSEIAVLRAHLEAARAESAAVDRSADRAVIERAYADATQARESVQAHRAEVDAAIAEAEVARAAASRRAAEVQAEMRVLDALRAELSHGGQLPESRQLPRVVRVHAPHVDGDVSVDEFITDDGTKVILRRVAGSDGNALDGVELERMLADLDVRGLADVEVTLDGFVEPRTQHLRIHEDHARDAEVAKKIKQAKEKAVAKIVARQSEGEPLVRYRWRYDDGESVDIEGLLGEAIELGGGAGGARRILLGIGGEQLDSPPRPLFDSRSTGDGDDPVQLRIKVDGDGANTLFGREDGDGHGVTKGYFFDSEGNVEDLLGGDGDHQIWISGDGDKPSNVQFGQPHGLFVFEGEGGANVFEFDGRQLPSGGHWVAKGGDSEDHAHGHDAHDHDGDHSAVESIEVHVEVDDDGHVTHHVQRLPSRSSGHGGGGAGSGIEAFAGAIGIGGGAGGRIAPRSGAREVHGLRLPAAGGGLPSRIQEHDVHVLRLPGGVGHGASAGGGTGASAGSGIGGGREVVVIHGNNSSDLQVHNHIEQHGGGNAGGHEELHEILSAMHSELRAIREELADLKRRMGSHN